MGWKSVQSLALWRQLQHWKAQAKAKAKLLHQLLLLATKTLRLILLKQESDVSSYPQPLFVVCLYLEVPGRMYL